MPALTLAALLMASLAQAHAHQPAPSDAGHAGMDHGAPPDATAEPTPPPAADHQAMDHGAMDHGAMDHGTMRHEMSGHDMAGHRMVGALGPYAMSRDASGTSWQPDAAPVQAIMGTLGGFSTMLHGYATLTWSDQGGPRGDEKLFVSSMLMGMAQRPVGAGTLTLRAMGSLDPLMGKRGYPLLLATGETADGETELVDRQHPHDLFMELAAAYSTPLAEGVSGFVYLGLPGEPAIGPATFMHRYAGLANPEAPITHHWLDSTHITFGVATLGVTTRTAKLEGSLFTGREPDQYRYDIERPRMDSWAARTTWNPTANLSLQASHARLESPEQLHPEEDVRRTSASATYGRRLGERGYAELTAAWGRNDPSEGVSTDAFILDGAATVERHTLFARLEHVDKDELFPDHDHPLHDRVFAVTRASLGYFYTLPVGRLGLDVGGLVSAHGLPAAIKPVYGGEPGSYVLFTRLKVIG